MHDRWNSTVDQYYDLTNCKYKVLGQFISNLKNETAKVDFHTGYYRITISFQIIEGVFSKAYQTSTDNNDLVLPNPFVP